MYTEDILIHEAQRLGFGVDLNFLQDIYIIREGRRKHQFASVNDALEWIRKRKN